MSWAEQFLNQKWISTPTPNRFKRFHEDDIPKVLVFLHGLGGNGTSWYRGLLDQIGTDTVLVCPNAPIPLDDGDSSFAWYFQIRDDVVRTELLLHSAFLLNELISKIPEYLNRPRADILLAGYSQGGTMSVTQPFVHPNSIGHSGCFCGYIANDEEIEVTKEKAGKTRFYWNHGKKDFENDFYLAEWGVAKLRKAEADLTFEPDEHLGHTVVKDRVVSMLRWWDDA